MLPIQTQKAVTQSTISKIIMIEFYNQNRKLRLFIRTITKNIIIINHNNNNIMLTVIMFITTLTMNKEYNNTN